jgi:hypothetical protein
MTKLYYATMTLQLRLTLATLEVALALGNRLVAMYSWTVKALRIKAGEPT